MTSALIRVTIRLPGTLAPEALGVTVIGAFNGWLGQSHCLIKQADADWMISVDHDLLGTTSPYSVRNVRLDTDTEDIGTGQIAAG